MRVAVPRRRRDACDDGPAERDEWEICEEEERNCISGGDQV